MKISQLKDGDFFTMVGDESHEIYQRVEQEHHSRPRVVEIARLTEIQNEEIPNCGMLYENILEVSEDTEVTPGTVKFTLDFRPLD